LANYQNIEGLGKHLLSLINQKSKHDFFLFVQAEIKEVVDEACDHLPNVIRQQCRSFVATYGDAFVALLAQEMDPSQVSLSLQFM
jgi:hypothetical protein